MNSVMSQLLSRTSVRNFTGEKVKDSDLDLILRAGQQAPTSINGQQISLIVTKDKATIRRIAEIAGGQAQVAGADVFVTIVIDFYRTSFAASLVGKHHVIESSAEGIIVGAGDAGIVLNALQTAANSLGYGSTAIGGIRRDPMAMVELLKLPEKTYPVFGLTLGLADASFTPKIKPRVPVNSFAMSETYDKHAVQEGLKEYDKLLRLWWNEQGLSVMDSYVEAVGNYYSSIYFPEVAKSFVEQGFAFKDE